MPIVETVRGPIDSSELGPTLMHEHIFVFTTEVHQNYANNWDEGARVAGAADRLQELYAAGVHTIVDLTVVGLGRDIKRIAQVAERTDLNIVVATGLYTYDVLPHYFRFRGPGTPLDGPEPMVEMFVTDITQGIAGTDIKAAILKCATDEQGVTPGVERVLRAVAAAHRETGVPISTHTHAASRSGLDQQRILIEEGVDLSRVIIGHSGDSTDIGYLEELIANGSFIGMDRFGVDAFLGFDDRVTTVATMCERGRADRMVLSHDASCHIDWFDDSVREALLPKWNYLHIHRDVLPALRDRGVTEDHISTMLVDNPRRILQRAGPADRPDSSSSGPADRPDSSSAGPAERPGLEPR